MDDNPTRAGIISRTLINVLSNYLGHALTIGVGLLLTPFMLHTLGDTHYGLWVLVGSVISYGSLLDLGLMGTIIKYVAAYHAQGDRDKLQKVITTGFWCYATLGLLAILASVLIAPLFPQWFQLQDADATLVQRLVMVMGLSFGISLPCSVPFSVLRGLQRFDLLNIATFVGTSLTALGMVIVLSTGGQIIEVAAVSIPVSFVSLVLARYLVRRVVPGMHIISRGMDLSLLPQIGSYSSLLLANQLANQINTRTDEIVIGAMLPIRLVAPFGIARRLSEAPQLFTNQFLKVIMPMASDLDAAQDQQRLRELHLTGTRIALLLFTPIGLAVTILSAPLLTVWVGAAYAQYNGLVGILVTAGLLNLTCWPAAAILQGMARHKVVAIASLVAAIGNLALSLFLVGPFGLSGVALGTLISYLIEWLFILPYTLRVLHVSIGEALRAIFLPVVMPALAMVLVLFAFQAWLHPTSLFMLGVCVAVSGLCYLLVYLPFSHTTFERKLVLQGLDQIWQRSLRLRAR